MTIAFTRTDQTAARCHLPILLYRSLSFLECHVPCAAEKLSRSECWLPLCDPSIYLAILSLSLSFSWGQIVPSFLPLETSHKKRGKKKKKLHHPSCLGSQCGTGSCWSSRRGQVVSGRKKGKMVRRVLRFGLSLSNRK